MKLWLAKNRSSYEFYLLHAITHDQQRRSALLSVPLMAEDFGTDECELVLSALKLGHNIGAATGVPMPIPPDFVYMRDHLRVAASQTEMGEDTLRGAERMLPQLLDPSYSSQWYCIDTYLEAWLTTARGKRYARQIQISPVADMGSVVDLIRRDMEAASAAVRTEIDDMAAVMDGTDMDMEVRKSTGIAGLDSCLNGGWGTGECYLLFGGTGGGKCHGIGTPILLADGTVERVEDIVVGAAIMGPDSLPRRVTELIRGRDEMFRITPNRGADPVVVNSEHTLTLAVTNIGDRVIRSADGVEGRSLQLIDVKLSDYLRSNRKFKHCTKWVQTGVSEFDVPKQPLEIPPYLLGFWLGDGAAVNPSFCKPGVAEAIRADVEAAGWTLNDALTLPDGHCETVNVTGGLRTTLRRMGLWGNKHVPQHYLTASYGDRELLLAGLLDTDGSVHRSGWEFSNTNKQIADAVVFLARSLGHSASSIVSRTTTCQTGVSCLSWRTHISPVGPLPTKLKIPPVRRQRKNPLTNGFSVEALGVGDYYGFSVEGPDKRYLLGDFSITHNSVAAAQCAWHEAISGGNPLIISTELSAHEYVARILSNACSIPIWVLQDCRNFAQMRQAVAMKPELSFHEGTLLKNMERIRTRLRIAKVRSEDGMNARSVIEREVARYTELYGVPPSWVCLDWLGTMADVGGAKDTSARAMTWELSATGCVKFAEESGIPTLILAQAVNDAQTKSILTINDIGIAKGIGKNMVAVIGVTNTIDKAGVTAAVAGKADMPKSMTLDDQLFCVCKARKGEGNNVQVVRQFKYQRFSVKPKT